MKKTLTIIALSFALHVNAQVIYYEGFESGNISNPAFYEQLNQPNQWVVGTMDAARGNYSLYVSRDGTNTEYRGDYEDDLSPESISHFGTYVTLPEGKDKIVLSFFHNGLGEINNDRLKIFWVEVELPITAGEFPIATQIGKSEYVNKYQWKREIIVLDNIMAGQSGTILFTWENDDYYTGETGAQLDEITIEAFDINPMTGIFVVGGLAASFTTVEEAIFELKNMELVKVVSQLLFKKVSILNN